MRSRTLVHEIFKKTSRAHTTLSLRIAFAGLGLTEKKKNAQMAFKTKRFSLRPSSACLLGMSAEGWAQEICICQCLHLGSLTNTLEGVWVKRQPFLLSRGYRLRPRYDPDWGRLGWSYQGKSHSIISLNTSLMRYELVNLYAHSLLSSTIISSFRLVESWMQSESKTVT